jgi:adenylosuccinate lyase
VVDWVSRRNVAGELSLMATENLLIAAVQAGGDRQALHERIRGHAPAAAGRLNESTTHGPGENC